MKRKYKNIDLITSFDIDSLQDVVEEIIEKNYFCEDDILSVEEILDDNDDVILVISTKSEGSNRYIYVGGRLFSI